MAAFTLKGGQTFPEGTSVGAYPRSAWPSWQSPTGAPSGSATSTGTVTNNEVTFTGLADATQYVAYASTPDRYKAFSTPAFVTTAPTIKVLTANMAAITANQTVQDIPGLGIDIGASVTEIWLMKFWILVQADNATMDVKFGWTNPSGATVRWGGIVGDGIGPPAGWGAPPTASATVTALGLGSTLSVGTASGPTNPTGVSIVAIVFGGGTAGTSQLRVAQNTSDPGALQILKGSLVEATKVAS